MSSFAKSAILAAAVLITANAAWCDDFLASGGSARTVATGGAWIPSSAGALDAMAINPAGLTMLSAPTLDASLESAFARGQFVNSANPNGLLNSNGAIPYGAFGMPLGSSPFSLGVAVLPELMSAANWRYTDTPGGVGGVSYGPLNNNSDILAMRAVAGLGWAVSKRVKIGASFGGVYNRNTLETAYVFQTNPALAGLKTLLDLHTSGAGWNGSAGVLVQASKQLQFGAAYRSHTTIQSTGIATGNAGIQFAQIGLGAARPDFQYDAEVDNTLPQSVTANGVWQATSRLRLVGQADWIDWRDAFTNLPVILTNGNNADINGLLQTNGIKDSIPLDWRNQMVERVGVERSWRENAAFRAGYAHANSPVPSSTLTPLTAAITRNTLSAGFGYQFGRCRLDAAYSVDPTAQQSVQQSTIKSGEYSNSRVSVGVQSVILTTSFRL
jgi:long-chain fatty acid transport protein